MNMQRIYVKPEDGWVKIAENPDAISVKCGLPLQDKAAAADAFATLSDASVFGQAVNFENGGETSPSWIEHHVCRHDETSQKAM